MYLQTLTHPCTYAHSTHTIQQAAPCRALGAFGGPRNSMPKTSEISRIIELLNTHPARFLQSRRSGNGHAFKQSKRKLVFFNANLHIISPHTNVRDDRLTPDRLLGLRNTVPSHGSTTVSYSSSSAAAVAAGRGGGGGGGTVDGTCLGVGGDGGVRPRGAAPSAT